MENAFWYCLAHAAQKHGVEVHAATLMSTHPHSTVTDVRGNHPDFKRDFHRNFANFIKVFRGWPGEVFDHGQGGEHEPASPEAMVRDIAYGIANPPAAFAVRYSKDWPGPQTRPRDIGQRVIRARRPAYYFSPNNPEWPEVIELGLTMPQILIQAYGEEGARRRIEEQVRHLERQALEESRKRGIPFKGARRVMRTPHTVRARSYEEFGGINPRFSAAGDRVAAARKLAELKRFDADYDKALARWSAGDRRVVFPFGTWQMRVLHKARVRPAPS